MLDLRWIRDNPDALDRNLVRRGASPMAARVLALDTEARRQRTALQALQERRKAASGEIGALMAAGRRDEAETRKREVAALKAQAQEAEERERAARDALDALLAGIPNLLAEDVPEGADESASRELRKVGAPPEFAFRPREHFVLPLAAAYMDFAAAARMSGSRFVVLRGPLARMERALGQFMLDIHTTEHGYEEVSPPLLVRDAALFGSGQLPKFADDLFRTTSGHWLIPTAEVPLANLVGDQILEEAALPLRFTALTACFRSEAGAAGKDTRGMLRHHQFYKVEMVSITHPDASEAEQQRMTRCAETVLQRLELPYRVVVLAGGDTGFSLRRTFDIEVWLPGQDRYREISSLSTCGDFQARRMGARFRPANGERRLQFVHTLNGSGLAVGRTLIAVLENYQQGDGSVVVPAALRPYMDGMERLAPQQ